MTEFRDVEDPFSRVDRLVGAADRQLMNAFLISVAEIRDRFTLEELSSLLEQGRLHDAFAIAEPSWRRFAGSWIRVYVNSAEEAARFIDDHLAAVVTFDQTNFAAVSQMQQNQLRLVRELTEAQRLATQEALIRGIRDGINPIEQARAFRDSIGLTLRQERAVANFRRLLESNSAESLTRTLRDRRSDRSIRRAIREKTPLDPAAIDRMVDRYRQRSLAFRARTIARTESLSAVHEGNSRMYGQAIEDGTLEAGAVTRTWNTSKDERVRSSHQFMHRQLRQVDEPFISGSGARLRFPGDPNAPAEERIHCRCGVSHRFTVIVEEELLAA